MSEGKLKLIIDTDPGHDDAMAILMLLPSEKIDILAITTVAGNSSVKNTTRNACYILNLVKRNNIPVYSGAAKPLVRDLIQADVHGASGLDGSTSQMTKKLELTNDAPKQLVRLIKQNPGAVTILALGPLTNIATALELDPSIIKKIKNLVIMGGAINVPGNKSRVAEFNFFVDPEAAKIVLNSNLKIILVPLDACNEILMTKDDIGEFGLGKIGKTLAKMLKPYIKNIAKFEGVKGAMMYDPLAAYFLLSPASYKTRLMDIVIETSGEFTAGMSVADQRLVSDKNPRIKVVTAINGKKFISDFIKSIKKIDERLENEK